MIFPALSLVIQAIPQHPTLKAQALTNIAIMGGILHMMEMENKIKMVTTSN
jgi:hypothetical protein